MKKLSNGLLIFPKRGIGDTTVARITVTASENNVPIWEVVANIGNYATGRTITPIEQFGTLIKSFKMMVEEGKDAYEVSAHIAKASGILA